MKIRIAVLLATHNGGKYISQQLDSIIRQKGNYTIDIFLSDDSSYDNTLNICQKKKYKKSIKKIFKVNFGSFSKNFLNLLKNVPKNYNYYCFCDQDDIWIKSKFKRAIKKLDKNISLYCSRTILVNEDLKIIGHSPLFKKTPSFENALVQSIAGGNTMVFNRKILKTLLKFKVYDAPSHDWLLYIITTAIGEKVFYDKIATVLYRQHDSNLVGTNNKIKDKIKRIFLLINGKFKLWSKIHIKIIDKNLNFLTQKNKETYWHFKKIRSNRFYFFKCVLNGQLRIYRQTLLAQIALVIGLLFRLI